MDDVLDCQLINVSGRIYRYFGTASAQHSARCGPLRAPVAATDGALETAVEETCSLDAVEAIDESGIEQQGGKSHCRIDLDPEVYPFIIGKGGSSKKQIEQATGATLGIPRRGDSEAAICISAPSSAAVARARQLTLRKIQAALAGRLLDFTHFVSLPLTSQVICSQVQAFQEQALAQAAACGALGLEESVFVKPQQLHLTVAMLKLYSAGARQRAQKVLERVRPSLHSLLQGHPLQVQLRGLAVMGGHDAAEAHVVYVQVHEVGPGRRLQQACELVIQELRAAGLATDQNALKLHATVINTRYRKPKGRDPVQSDRQLRNERQPADVRQLLDSFSGLDLGQHMLPEMHLSIRGEMDGQSGYYKSLYKLQLPHQQ